MAGDDLSEYSDREFDDPVERQHVRRAVYELEKIGIERTRRAVKKVERYEWAVGFFWKTAASGAAAAGFVWASRDWLAKLVRTWLRL